MRETTMTDDTKLPDAPAASAPLDTASGSLPNPSPEAVKAIAADDPMERAKAGGYVEEPLPSMRERVEALVASFEHAMAHNAPVTPAMMAEMKALLLGE
jgi:hypothetical protein